MNSSLLSHAASGFVNTGTLPAAWLKSPARAGVWKLAPMCKTGADSPSGGDIKRTDAVSGRMSRRAMLQSASALALVPMLQGWTGGWEAKAAATSSLDASEGLSLLRTMNVRVDDLQARAAFGDLNDLRRALRSEPFGRLRLAVAAVSAGSRQKNIIDAAKSVRMAVESADITALRASRGQTAVDDVPPRLEDLRNAIANLITLVDVNVDDVTEESDEA